MTFQMTPMKDGRPVDVNLLPKLTCLDSIHGNGYNRSSPEKTVSHRGSESDSLLSTLERTKWDVVGKSSSQLGDSTTVPGLLFPTLYGSVGDLKISTNMSHKVTYSGGPLSRKNFSGASVPRPVEWHEYTSNHRLRTSYHPLLEDGHTPKLLRVVLVHGRKLPLPRKDTVHWDVCDWCVDTLHASGDKEGWTASTGSHTSITGGSTYYSTRRPSWTSLDGPGSDPATVWTTFDTSDEDLSIRGLRSLVSPRLPCRRRWPPGTPRTKGSTRNAELPHTKRDVLIDLNTLTHVFE